MRRTWSQIESCVPRWVSNHFPISSERVYCARRPRTLHRTNRSGALRTSLKARRRPNSGSRSGELRRAMGEARRPWMERKRRSEERSSSRPSCSRRMTSRGAREIRRQRGSRWRRVVRIPCRRARYRARRPGYPGGRRQPSTRCAAAAFRSRPRAAPFSSHVSDMTSAACESIPGWRRAGWPELSARGLLRSDRTWCSGRGNTSPRRPRAGGSSHMSSLTSCNNRKEAVRRPGASL